VANSDETGWFTEAALDGVYISRYDHDALGITQLRRGYTLPALHGPELFGAIHIQPYWNLNATADVQREWWANYAETGPGLRLRWSTLPPSLSLRADFLRGVYLVNKDNPHRPNFWDMRASLWYAFTR
jgi:hypothetical protein